MLIWVVACKGKISLMIDKRIEALAHLNIARSSSPLQRRDNVAIYQRGNVLDDRRSFDMSAYAPCKVHLCPSKLSPGAVDTWVRVWTIWVVKV